jgi:PIN domain nuclease of toxin-antitoxin system
MPPPGACDVRLLLDTHAYYWWRADRKRLSTRARAAIEDRGNDLFVSAATVWELAIKAHNKSWESARLLLLDLEQVMSDAGAQALPISLAHAREAGSLPLVHRDPFDRMLVAQARVDEIQLVSNETLFDAYGVLRLW